MHFLSSVLTLLGRWAIAAIFLISGLLKFVFYSSTLDYMVMNGLPYAGIFLVLAALLEILAAASLILGWKTRWAALVLALYLIPVTFVFHDFWNIEDRIRAQDQFYHFLKNLAIFGGLFLLIGRGAGGFAVDACCHHPENDSK